MSEPTTRFLVGRQDEGKRLDRFLGEKIRGLSRTRIQRMIEDRVVLSWIDRSRCSTPVRPGGEVRIVLQSRPEPTLSLHLAVVHRSRTWIAIDKPPGLPVHPAGSVKENSVIRMLRRQEGEEGLRLAHRLDRDTSGALLVAANSETARWFGEAFMTGRVRKEYLAMVHGVVTEAQGCIDRPIGDAVDSKVHIRQRVGVGKSAVTRFRVERRFVDRTLLRLFPQTGRRHQLRVHLESIGHPIVGDWLYGRSDDEFLNRVADDDHGADRPRQLLHSSGLAFVDPDTGEGRTIRVVPPADLRRAMELP